MEKNLSKNTLSVGFVPLGCPKAIVDSERMLAEIAQAGFPLAADPDTADIVVINTCAFIAPAINEAMQAIKHALQQKKHGAVKKVIVAGCLPQRVGMQLFQMAEGIDAVVGLAYRDKIGEIIKRTISCEKKQACIEPALSPVADDRTRLPLTPPHYAYLRISEGCSRRCSFCTIPFIRGKFRSKPIDNVLAEADELVCAGAVELNIIAQDTTSYGRDLKLKNGLCTLLAELEKIPRLKWLRLMYLYPAAVTARLIETIAESKKIVHYLDIPIQHINNQILGKMHRSDTNEKICRLIQSLRRTIDDVVLRTTVIVGFPGETDRQFQELIDFIRWAEFDALGCFKFYAESGTAAADMPAQVPENVKDRRLDKVMLTQQKIAFAKNNARTGTDLTCLVDSLDENAAGKARFYGQAPDIDSVCIIKNCSGKPGAFLPTRVIAAENYDLVVKQI